MSSARTSYQRIFVLNEPVSPRINPALAVEIGLNESIVLLQIEYWISVSQHFIDGQRWTYQSVREMQKKVFPFWSIATINRTVQSLLQKGYIIEGNFNKAKYDKTRWFALNFEKLSELKSIAIQYDTGVFQNETRSTQNETHSTQNETTIPKTTTETTTEIDNILSFEEIEPQKDVIPYQEIVDYLNLKAGTSYRHSTSSTQKLIRARWNEGFRLDDFKQVIDNMTAKWKGDPKMEQYLRPQTLFGTKFESYLQITSKTKPKEDDPYDEDDWGFKKV
jgi:uncharacterized phage protein (TIGR02220 family)